MNPNATEILAALPIELRGPIQEEGALATLLNELARQQVPTGRAIRLWKLGSLQARILLAYLWAGARKLALDPKERAMLADQTHLRAAWKLFESMGYLRGAVAKLGQTLASYPELLPERYHEVLDALQFQAPPMHYSLLREQVRSELCREPEELFAHFETEAFAAASLGQVHRARTKSGERVAVKLQYPNIARTIESDLANAKSLLLPLRLLRDGDALARVIEDVRTTLLLETDYRHELQMLERSRSILAGLERVRVPRAYPELSSERVLTLELLEGSHLRDWSSNPRTQAERDAFGELIVRANYRLWASGHLIHADPNAGNYLFLPDGTLGLLDFGCVRALEGEEWQVMELATRWERTRSDADFVALLERSIDRPRSELERGERKELLRRSVEWIWEPGDAAQPYDFSQGDYLQRGFAIYKELTIKRYTRSVPVFTWFQRMLLGVRALLVALGARVHYRQIHEEELSYGAAHQAEFLR